MPTKKITRYSGIFFFACVLWLILGVLHLGVLFLELPPADRQHYISLERTSLFAITYCLWALFTTFSYYLIEKHPPSKESFIWIVNLSLAAIIWLVIVVLFKEYMIGFLWGTPSASILTIISQETPFLYLFNTIKIILNYGICAGVFYYSRIQDARIALLNIQRQIAEASEKKSQFQLRALQSQLSPHFLFNCLNSVSALARCQDYARIIVVIADLAALLRYAIDGTQKAEVTLREELDFTEHYLALQLIRFEGCFNCSIESDADTLAIACPPFCIQILAENIFSHNQLSTKTPISIRINITKNTESLRIKVENSPVVFTDNNGSGTALNNLNERLELLYGGKAALTATYDEHRFLVTLDLPIRNEHD